MSQRNQLDVLVPPVINMLNPGNNITVRRGSTVKLSCNATGFPPPEIVWQREVKRNQVYSRIFIIVPLVIKVPQSNGGVKIGLYDFLNAMSLS